MSPTPWTRDRSHLPGKSSAWLQSLLPLCVCVLSRFSCVWFLCNPIDGNPPGSFVQAILPATILKWVGISSSRGPSQPREDQTHISCIGGIFFTCGAIWEALLPSVYQKSLGPKPSPFSSHSAICHYLLPLPSGELKLDLWSGLSALGSEVASGVGGWPDVKTPSRFQGKH